MSNISYILLFSFLFYFCSCSTYTLVVDKKSEYCIGEYLSEGTVGAPTPVNMKIKGPSNDELYKKQDKVNAVASLTAPKTGSYTMCLENKEPQSVHVNFEFLSGVNAKDYSSIAKQSSLKPLELNLQKLEDTIGYIINEMSNIVVYQEKSLAVNDELGGKIILFSCITMFTMIIVGIIETVYIQKYLTNKKII